MPRGDKYVGLTNYLKAKHANGIDFLTMTFAELEAVLGFKLPASTSKYCWSNDKTQSYALGWLHAGFIVDRCNLLEQKITFRYKPDRVKELLSGTES